MVAAQVIGQQPAERVDVVAAALEDRPDGLRALRLARAGQQLALLLVGLGELAAHVVHPREAQLLRGDGRGEQRLLREVQPGQLAFPRRQERAVAEVAEPQERQERLAGARAVARGVDGLGRRRDRADGMAGAHGAQERADDLPAGPRRDLPGLRVVAEVRLLTVQHAGDLVGDRVDLLVDAAGRGPERVEDLRGQGLVHALRVEPQAVTTSGSAGAGASVSYSAGSRAFVACRYPRM